VAGCSVVLLAATEVEAAPLTHGLERPRRNVVATKTVTAGLLDPPGLQVLVAVGGCDKTNTAHILTCLLQEMVPAPRLVLQTGIAGAFPATDGAWRAEVGDVVLATEEIYVDTGCAGPEGWLSAQDLGLPIAEIGGRESGNRFTLDPRLVEAAAEIVVATGCDGSRGRPSVVTGPFATSSRVTGTRKEGEEIARRWAPVAESMEGAAAAHICALYGVPFLEIRGVSNLIVDRDRDAWQVERAIEVAAAAASAVCCDIDRLLPER